MSRWIVRKAFDALPFRFACLLFRNSARRIGVTTYQIEGDYGAILAPVYDNTIAQIYLKNRTWSPVIVNLFRDFFAKRGGGIFYDIGANIGLTAIPIAQNANVQVTAFEPEPGNFSFLAQNVAANCRHNNVLIRNIALADRTCDLGFSRSTYNSGDHRISDKGAAIVKARPLDDFPPPDNLPFAVKIDTQGAEPMIVRGGREVLARADLVVMEYWPWGMGQAGSSPDGILGFVQQHFTTASLLKEGEDAPAYQPIREGVAGLANLGTTFSDSVDLVLRKGA